jgi:RNA polymerase-binding transcription factor DksA
MAKGSTGRKPPTARAATTKKASVNSPADKSASAAGTRKVTAKASTAKTTKASASDAKKAAAPKKAATKATAKSAAKTTKAAPVKAAAAKKAAAKATAKAPAKKKEASPFDAKFLDAQHALLIEERARLVHDADSLTAEANALAEGREPGDVQFDEESGEGDTLAVERERDLALSAQFRSQVEEIDRALAKFDEGTYGICEVSGTPIPKERLKAIPWARERVEYKVGGFGRR